ncbi:MAG: RNA methyltransferase [Flavobacterium sp.]|jgi:TrmH family RNA methyltransferase
MFNKNLLKQISLLQQKKNRLLQNSFVVEGEKSILEFLQSHFKLKNLLISDINLLSKFKNAAIIKPDDMKKISSLSSPSQALAVFEIPKPKPIQETGIILALDQINDPGNLGTIIRLCDWFGIEDIVCSTNTVDVFNPKVIQATMGSLTRVNITYLNLLDYLKNSNLTIYGTFIDGLNIYQTQLPKNAIIIMGNEANGISTEIESIITQKITIPSFNNHQKTESLNVATATAIVLSEFSKTKFN